MRINLVVASVVTLGILLSFVFFVFYLIAFWTGILNIWSLVWLTVVTNIILWLINPMIMDWIQNIFYKIRQVPFDEFRNNHKDVADFIEEVCKRNRIRIPSLRIIEDDNPTAYCYGSFHQNARVVVSKGIFKYLTIEEQKAVIGHEIGHIVNKDFIIMTIAVTLLQILYEIYHSFLRRRRSSGSKKGDITPLIGAISYFLYIVGSYLILYLSRTREYLADRFSALQTGNPDALSLALVKIAYGIAAEADTESTQRLLASTRAMGIYDFKAAQSIGTAFRLVMTKDKSQFANDITKVFLFDIFSPWGIVSEINSTHPLTGKRIRALSQQAKAMNKTSIFDFERVVQEGGGLDRNRLYSGFFTGMIICTLPFVALLAGMLIIISNPMNYIFLIGLLGVSIFIRGLYMFRRPGGVPEKTTVFELMQDPYANPLKGRYVEIEGNVIGKADAGSYFGEDVKMQDRSGCLIYLNYESIVPILGNIIFGLGKAASMIGKHCRAVGWFRRSSYQIVDLAIVEVDGDTIKSYTRFLAIWGAVIGFCLIILVILHGIKKAGF